MTKKTLSISWMNRTLTVAVCHGGMVRSSWECDHPVEHIGEWAPALRAAMAELDFRGSDAVVVLDHRNLVYHIQDAPPGTARTVRPFLERKVAQQRFFEEDAVWGAHPPAVHQGEQRFLLSILPRSVLQGLQEVCTEEGLELVGVFSPATVLAAQFKRLHLQPSESALLVADLGGSLCLVAGRGDGQVLFCRHLTGLGAPHHLRAGQEIHRTLLFIQQQFGITIQSLWVFGAALFEWLSEMTIREGLTIRRSPEEEGPGYYAAAASALPALHTANLISETATRRRIRRRQTAIASLALFLAALAMNYAVARASLDHDAETALRTRSWNQLEHYRDVLQFRQREIILLQESLARIGSTNSPPILPVFLSTLATSLPDTLKLTGCALAETEEGFTVRLEGYGQSPDAPILPLLEQLESQLAQGMFGVEIFDGTRRRVLGTSGSSGALPLASAPAGFRPFFVEGRFR